MKLRFKQMDNKIDKIIKESIYRIIEERIHSIEHMVQLINPYDSNDILRPVSYERLIRYYGDYCLNKGLEDVFWTFFYEDGKMLTNYGKEGWYGKALPKRGLVGIIYQDAEDAAYWYKNEIGLDIILNLTDYVVAEEYPWCDGGN